MAERAAEAIRKAIAETHFPLRSVILQVEEHFMSRKDGTWVVKRIEGEKILERHVYDGDAARASLLEAKYLIAKIPHSGAFEVLAIVINALGRFPAGLFLKPIISHDSGEPLSEQWVSCKAPRSGVFPCQFFLPSPVMPLYDALTRLEAIATMSGLPDEITLAIPTNEHQKMILKFMAAKGIDSPGKAITPKKIQITCDIDIPAWKVAQKALTMSGALIPHPSGTTRPSYYISPVGIAAAEQMD